MIVRIVLLSLLFSWFNLARILGFLGYGFEGEVSGKAGVKPLHLPNRPAHILPQHPEL